MDTDTAARSPEPDAPASVVLGLVSAGQHRIKVRAAQQDDPSSPVVVLVPAMGVPARYYRPFVADLHRQGLTVVTFDLRGQGESKPLAARGVRFGYESLIDDLNGVLDLIEDVFPRAPRFLLGHSLGGQIALLHTARHRGRVRGVALVASGSVWFRSFPGVYKLRTLVGTQAVASASTLLGYWPGHRFGFGGRQATGLMRDWARQARTSKYRLHGSATDYEAALREVQVPLLTVSVAGDRLAPQSSVDHLAAKARHALRTSKHYTRAESGAENLGHFSWVRNGAALSQWVRDWITSAHEPSVHS
ncbi:Predicted alpha/beta hydrolase [Saccharopolyspora antimicrobica]|uniref:Alpha/beta hydrolase n=1 Tax=Saccharopolyspora antimicrobica TaxID=455193 RepID=A0A1I5HQR5_9PSEU|nr:alpha/beta fold hydrolase [Saccharopolyspora antimicrobica]RKT82376.1 putative alpha/beta hydrolase [Saccharopolyspora antimicrobica]SFO50675.1 Predicted alpha/beta hydrolase [Saccharopolyspora antimicrobica]